MSTDPNQSADFLSQIFRVNKRWKSMEGPSSGTQIALHKPQRPEVVWLTGYRAKIVSGEEDEGVSQEFMCHNNLDFDLHNMGLHRDVFGWDNDRLNGSSSRVFTLSQGQFEVMMPEGFGVPVRSDERLFISTQVLNHNYDDAGIDVRHRTSVDYVADSDLDESLKPLYQSAISVMVSLDDAEAYYGVMDPDVVHEGTACAVGQTPEAVEATASVFSDDFGRKFSGHWVVEPGRQTRRTLVTKQLDLTFDTTIHYISTHVHPFCESFTLRDLTTGETLFTAHPKPAESGIGVTDVEIFSSAEGIPIYMDHDYELVVVYDNPTGVDQDAMASFFLYMYDEAADRSIRYLRDSRKWKS